MGEHTTPFELISDWLENLNLIIRSSKGSYEDLVNLEKLSHSFITIHTAIQNEEVKYWTWKGGIHPIWWMLRDLAYDIEDFIYLRIPEAFTSQHEVYDGQEIARIGTRALNSRNSSSNWGSRIHDKVRKSFLPCLHFTGIPKLLLSRGIRDLKGRLEEITSAYNRISSNLRSSYTKNIQFFPEIDDEAVKIFGRDFDKKIIIKMLLLNEEKEESQWSLPVISIVGSAGIGKTTLAQFVYSDERVVSHFETRIWLNFDFDCSMGRISMSEHLTNKDSSDPLKHFEERIRGQRFLIVLDGMSFVNIGNEWVRFRHCLESGAWGSRLLVTTRSDNVARQVDLLRSSCHTSKIYDLQPLNNEACLWVFNKYINIENFEKAGVDGLCHMIKYIRSKIIFPDKRIEDLFDNKVSCERSIKTVEVDIYQRAVEEVIGGVPACAKAWAFLLNEEVKRNSRPNSSYLLDFLDAYRVSEEEHTLRKVVIWDERAVNLPSHLKPCFMYCSLLPKGCWIVKEVLTQLWMAEGFIPLDDEMGENTKELGDNYLDDLVSHFRFHYRTEADDIGNRVRFKMTEHFHDFVRRVSRIHHGFIDRNSNSIVLKSTRHLSIFCDEDTTSIPSNFYCAKGMRTLLCFGNPQNLAVSREMFSHFKVLRVLDLSSTNIREFSYPPGALKHLRYLDLSYTRIKKLPQSICRLCFLQTLKVSHSLLCALPTETRKLISLRHLEIDATCMTYLPHGLQRLTKIRKLTDFIVGEVNGCSSIGELGNLNFLRGRLIISYLNRLTSREEAREAKLDEKNHIECLVFDGKKHLRSQHLDRKRYFDPPILELYKEAIGLSNEIDINDIDEVIRMRGVFEGLKPHVNLRRLEIWNYIGSTFPNWMEDASLTNLVYVKIVKCVKVKELPTLGNLPSLKCLHMHRMVNVEHIGHEFYGDGDVKGFPKLERLVLEGMSSWKEWDLSVEDGDMPCIAELIITDCPSLKTLPSLPNTLRKLEICNCEVLPNSHSLPTVQHLVLKGRGGMLCSLPKLPELESLKITMSSELTSLPLGLGHLTTLETLTIHFCPKLESLPQELQLLTKLRKLCIAGCPLLTEQYQKERMDDWRKIAHIRNVEIDSKKVI